LFKEKLVDEFYLLVVPIVSRNGKTIFKDLKGVQKLTLIDSKVFDCGLVLLHYEIMKNKNLMSFYYTILFSRIALNTESYPQ
jgi:dihydrofolate reductase